MGLIGFAVSLEDVEVILCGPDRDQVLVIPDSAGPVISRAFLEMAEEIMSAKEAAEGER